MLREAYRDYLFDGARKTAAEALARAFDASDVETAEFLRAYARAGSSSHVIARGPRAGQTAFVGFWPPPSSLATVWFDVVDLSINLFLPPSEDPEWAVYSSWFAMRPVKRFQFGAFLDVAPIERHQASALDPARLLAGDENEAVSPLMFHEAGLYGQWVGKLVACWSIWMRARALLPELPWGDPAREWSGSSSKISGMDECVTPVMLDQDEDTRDESFDDWSYREGALPKAITFRTGIRNDVGMYTGRRELVHANRSFASLSACFSRHVD